MRKSLIALLAMAAAWPALSQTATSRTVWVGRDAVTHAELVPPVETGTQALCDAALAARNVTARFTCERERRTTRVEPTPPPSCPPAPAAQTRQTACPVGTEGLFTQTRSATVGPPTACLVTWTDWLPTSPPAGSCPATPPPPPPPPPSGAYDVQARIAAFNARLSSVRPGTAWTFDLPTAPNITSRRTVSTAAEMQAAMGVPGVEVTFSGSGFTGTLRPRADQRWIFPAGFTLTGPSGGVAIGVDQTARVALVGTGGRAVGAFQARQVADLLVKGMNIRAGTGQYASLNSVDQSQRVLIEGSYLYAPSYGLIYSDNGSVVLANSEVHSEGLHATTRGARNATTLLMDSRIVTAGNQQQVRQHAGSPRFAAFNLQIEGGTGSAFMSAGDPCPAVHDLVMLDNSYYGSGDTIWIESGCVAGGTIVGNRGFTSWGSGSQISVNMPAGSVVRDNPRLPYQAPPAWQRQ